MEGLRKRLLKQLSWEFETYILTIKASSRDNIIDKAEEIALKKELYKQMKKYIKNTSDENVKRLTSISVENILDYYYYNIKNDSDFSFFRGDIDEIISNINNHVIM
ncbi:hypothetical protein SAMN02745111_02404 [Eubacterium uniforme]|uniref:Uncharacterized protein n=1 Tax=Eubacterium uniforme TaxID=39495 RepID=A0A1T4W6A4_9FIRM|nr:hypothetical protein [Eubacterium uniforme]SKA72727.1 hypothetical protein SAMN02745111_02404 [Eubacterium uniforme]